MGLYIQAKSALSAHCSSVLPVEIYFKCQDNHANAQAHQGGNKDPTQGGQGDALRVIQGWAQTPQCSSI